MSASRQHRQDRVARRERFEALYIAHYGAIFRFVDRRADGPASEVPDVVADVFMAVWRRLDEVPEGDAARLWLYGVARRSLLNVRRGRRRRWRLLSRLSAEAAAATTAQVAADPGDAVLREAIRRLPDPYREVLQLVAWDGLSHAEAAQVLDCSTNAVALRLHKAKARLREDPLVAARLQLPRAGNDRAIDAQRK
jgi:RNA polymerase sigma factor (sigma-70 family)